MSEKLLIEFPKTILSSVENGSGNSPRITKEKAMSEKLIIEEIHLHIVPEDYPRPDLLRIEVDMTINGKRFVNTRRHVRNDFECYFDFYWDTMRNEIKEYVPKEFQSDD